jgi:hypothetical protein
MTRSDLIDSDPITLTEASKLVLRGVVSVSALRAEMQRGNLMTMRIGKNLFTTPAAIREMMEKCRVKPHRLASTSDRTIEPGSSETRSTASELAALNASVTALKSGSLSTLRKNTSHGLRSGGDPVPFPSRKS